MRYSFQTDKLTSGLFVLFILIFTSTLAFSEVIDLSPSQDTFVNSKKTNNSYGSNSYIRLRESRRVDRYGLIKFGLDEIPQGSDVQSAKLKVFVTYKRSFNNILTVSEVLDDWNESAKWNNKPDMSSLSEDSVSIDSGGIYYELDVTGMVQDWVDGAADNNGLYLVISNGHIYINSSENSSNQPILSVTYSSPEPALDPAPEPEPDPGPGTVDPDTGVSDAPLFPANKRVLVVSKDNSGDYSTISDAINSVLPGDTIQVKDGIYVERVDFNTSGTRDLPIALVNYPGHKPVIDPGGGEYPEDCCPSGGTPRVEIDAEWIIVEGFEIRYGWDGIKIYEGHNTIRNNWIHHNKKQGILVVSTNDIFIHGNTIEYNGTDQGTCIKSGEFSPKHCHAIYLSDFSCEGVDNITIRGNLLSNHGGRGIQWNGLGCGSVKMRNTLVENNIIENNSWGIVLYYNVENSLISNNTFVLESYPETNDNSHTFISIWDSTGNIITNNIFYSTRDDVSGVHIRDSESTQNTFDYNLWKVENEWWVWEGGWRGDYNNYQNVTGWDSNSIMGEDPGFFDLSGGDYHITSGSPARDSGNNQSCALGDLDNELRDDQVCDIGADEYL
jgi:parallel beta-helix repeat protein